MKTGFLIGCAAGAVLGVAVGLAMDLLLGGGAGGSWSAAVSRDLERATGASYPPGSLAVAAGVVGVIVLLGLGGALVGGAAGALVGRFVAFLDKAA
ncbi:MAG: hypothetical protein ACYC8T_29935 [Myxococcaceae bacterium]